MHGHGHGQGSSRASHRNRARPPLAQRRSSSPRTAAPTGPSALEAGVVSTCHRPRAARPVDADARRRVSSCPRLRPGQFQTGRARRAGGRASEPRAGLASRRRRRRPARPATRPRARRGAAVTRQPPFCSIVRCRGRRVHVHAHAHAHAHAHRRGPNAAFCRDPPRRTSALTDSCDRRRPQNTKSPALPLPRRVPECSAVAARGAWPRPMCAAWSGRGGGWRGGRRRGLPARPTAVTTVSRNLWPRPRGGPHAAGRRRDWQRGPRWMARDAADEQRCRPMHRAHGVATREARPRTRGGPPPQSRRRRRAPCVICTRRRGRGLDAAPRMDGARPAPAG